MAALFGALLTLYLLEDTAGRADQAAIGGDQARAALIDRMRTAVALEERAAEDRAAGRGAAGETEPARNLLPQLLAAEQSLERELADARQKRRAARLWLRNVLLAFGLLGPLAALLINLAGSAAVVRRLRLAAENARRLARGEPLDETVEGADEIAALTRQIRDDAAIMQERERLVRSSERRYRDLFDRAPVPYEETDSAGIIRRLNQEVCNLLRCGPERILGSAAWDFVDPDQRAQFRADMLDRIARAVEIGPFECEFLLEDGTRLALEIRESLIRSETGEVTGVCRSLLDVTERKLAAVAARKVAQYAMELRNRNEQLAHALEAARSATDAKSRFLTSVSHELRTPLNGIIGFSELLYDGKAGELAEEHRELLGDILSSARHLLRLISDILDLSKVEAGRMEFHAELSELDPLVQEVRDVIRPLADRKRIRLYSEVPTGFSAELDRGRFKQVLYNYLSNAVKFTPEGGAIWIRILPAGQSFRLEVEDTGVGIPLDETLHLFQDFQQLSSGPRSNRGTGLGLALTRHIVEAQGGTVGVRSTPGSGSVFSAVLPVHPKQAAPVG